VYTADGQRIDLGTELGRGGEGTIYAIPAQPLECAKIYNKPLPSDETRKLQLMAESPPQDPAYDSRKHHSIAWPTALLFVDRRRSTCLGFIMHRIDVKLFKKALSYLDPADRRKAWGGSFTWRKLFVVARNVASAVAAIHEQGYCIGDLNESNVLVSPWGLISLIDCDSFQVTDPKSGKVYRCPVGKGEYTAPELQGKSYRDVDRTAQSDRFALGVFTFQLLMEGTHPYQAKGAVLNDAPSIEAKILRGCFPYDGKVQGVAPPDHAPPFEILHPHLRELFRRCFVDGHSNAGLRPSAEEWLSVLDGFANEFNMCVKNGNHFYLNHLKACPWCEVRRAKGHDLYPSPIGQQISLEGASGSLDSLDKRLLYLEEIVAMALADGVVTDEEREYIVHKGLELQIPRRDIDQLLTAKITKSSATAGTAALGTPVILVSPLQFSFPAIQHGSVVHEQLSIRNDGGGVLTGTIRANKAWLSTSQANIDPRRHHQEVIVSVNTKSLSLGSSDSGSIEIASTGGNVTVPVQVSIEIPESAIRRYRTGLVAWYGLVGMIIGAASSQLIRLSTAWAGSLAIATLLAVLGVASSGFGVSGAAGCGTIVVAWIALMVLAGISDLQPLIGYAIAGALAWSVVYGGIGFTTARAAFKSKARGAMFSPQPLVVCVLTTVIIALLGAKWASSSPNLFRSVERARVNGFKAPRPAVQLGRVTTCASATGYKRFRAKATFVAGERLCLYAEAVGVGNGRVVDLVVDVKLLSPNGNPVLAKRDAILVQTRNRVWPAIMSFDLPRNLEAGQYKVQVDVQNNLTRGLGHGFTNFVIAAKPAASVSAAVLAPDLPAPRPSESSLSTAAQADVRSDVRPGSDSLVFPQKVELLTRKDPTVATAPEIRDRIVDTFVGRQPPTADPTILSVAGTWTGSLGEKKRALIDLAPRLSMPLTLVITQDGTTLTGTSALTVKGQNGDGVVTGTIWGRIAADTVTGQLVFRSSRCSLTVNFVAHAKSSSISGSTKTTTNCTVSGVVEGTLKLKRQ